MFPKKENKLRRYNNFAHKDILLHYPAEQFALFRDSFICKRSFPRRKGSFMFAKARFH